MTNYEAVEINGAQSVTADSDMPPGAPGTPPEPSPDLAATLPESLRQPKLYLAILCAAVFTAIAYNILFGEATRFGLNLGIAVLLFAVEWFVIGSGRQVPIWRKLCVAAAVICAGASGIRNSEILTNVNFLLLTGFGALACTAAQTPVMKSLLATLIDLFQLLFNFAMGPIFSMVEVPWRRLQSHMKGSGTALRIALGFVISAPFLLVFGLLFSEAEVQFGVIFQTIFQFLLDTLFQHFWISFWTAFFTLGLLRCSFISASLTGQNHSIMRPHSMLGFVEAATVLSLLNGMFLVFVITQLPYLFGGQARVTSTPNLALSTYARSGFFELAWVAALLIPTLMLFLSLTRVQSPGQRKLLQGLSIGLTALAGIIIMSALQRMLLYTSMFGLTELRVYVSTFIVMVAIILLMLNVLHATDRGRYFVPASLAVGLLFQMGIQVPNVEGMVATDIIARHVTGKNGDMDYLRQLSADAVPAILESPLPKESKQDYTGSILSKRIGPEETGLKLDRTVSELTAREAAVKAGLTWKKTEAGGLSRR